MNPNQFNQTVVKGQADLGIQPSVITCVVEAAPGSDIIAGQCVKFKGVAGAAPVIAGIGADTDNFFGVALYNLKGSSFGGSESLEVATDGSVVYMEAAGAITAGDEVMPVVTGAKVTAASGSAKARIGIALDAAAADGDLIRVFIGKTYDFTPTV